MELPALGLTMEGLEKAIEEHVTTHYRIEDGELLCGTCGSKIEVVRGTAGLCHGKHPREPWHIPCGGGGDTQEFALPYCPTCEGPPKETYTHVHTLPMDQVKAGKPAA